MTSAQPLRSTFPRSAARSMSRSATPNRVVVRGTATVRWGLSAPSTAYELVKQVAANPPILQDGDTIRLRPPAGADEQRAMTVAYDVSCSARDCCARRAATRVRRRSAESTVACRFRTQSAAIDVRDLGGDTDVTTGSGAVQADGVNGDLSVATQSSRILRPQYRWGPSRSHPERRCRRKPSRARATWTSGPAPVPSTWLA